MTGRPVVLTLSNGPQIVIGVGQAGGVDSRCADDAYVQGTRTSRCGLRGTRAGTMRTWPDGHGADECDGRRGHDDGDLEHGGAGDGGGRLDDPLHGERGQRGDGSDLVLTLSNGSQITIAVGQTTGFVDVPVRADDAYVQGTRTSRCGLRGTRAGTMRTWRRGGRC